MSSRYYKEMQVAPIDDEVDDHNIAAVAPAEDRPSLVSSTSVDFLSKEQRKLVDKNGDGQIDDNELKEMIQSAIHGKQELKLYRYAFVIFGVIWFVSLTAIFAVVYGAIQMSKDSKVESTENPVLVTPDGKRIVRTANSDFYVTADGALKARLNNVTSSDNSGDGTLKVTSTSLTTSVPLSSDLPDAVFREIKNIGISSSIGAKMELNVLGMLRMPPTSVNHLGAVTLITHVGRILIEGSSISYFDDNQAELFRTAGFFIAPAALVSGRRLLEDVASVTGTFNAVPAVTSTSVTNATSSFLLPTPTLPANFIMTAMHLTPCVSVPTADGNIFTEYEANYRGGALPTDAGVDLCHLLQISEDHIVQVSDNENSRYLGMKYTLYKYDAYVRVEYVHPLHPNYAFVQVWNQTISSRVSSFQYQVDATSLGYRMQHGGDASANASFDLVGPYFYYGMTENTKIHFMQETLMSKFDYLGETKLGDDAVRVWAMHLADNDLHSYWYDDVHGQAVRRINFGSFGMLEVESLVALENAANLNFLFEHPPLERFDQAPDTKVPARVGMDAFLPYMDDYRSYVRWNALAQPVYKDMTSIPSANPTFRPTRTARPSATPTRTPTMFPSVPPTINPTAHPTESPTLSPSAFPTSIPTEAEVVEANTDRRMTEKDAVVTARLRASRHISVKQRAGMEQESLIDEVVVPVWKRQIVNSKKETKALDISIDEAVTTSNFFDGNWDGLNVVVEQTVGCASTNKCPRIFNTSSQAYSFAEFPGVVFTPLRPTDGSRPCFFAAEVLDNGKGRRRLLEARGASVIDFSVAGYVDLLFCKDLKGISEIVGDPTLNFDFGLSTSSAAASNIAKVFDFTAQNVNLLKTSAKTEMPTFDIAADGSVIFNDAELGDRLLQKVRNLATSNRARANAIKQCLKKNIPRDEVRFDAAGAAVDGIHFSADFPAFAALLRKSHLITNIEWKWNPYFCGLSGETRKVAITFSMDLFFTQYSMTIYSNVEEVVHFFEQGMPVASMKLDRTALLNDLLADYQALQDILAAKRQWSNQVWTDIQGFGSRPSEAVQIFKQLNIASHPRYQAVTDILAPSIVSKTGSSVGAMFATGNSLSGVYQLDDSRVATTAIEVQGSGCQWINTIDPHEDSIANKLDDACMLDVCDNKAYSFGSWVEDFTTTYQCYVAFDGKLTAASKDLFIASWEQWQENSNGGRMRDPQNADAFLTKSLTTMKSVNNNDYVRAFVFCTAATVADETIQKFAGDVLLRARQFSANDWNSVVPLASSYGFQLVTEHSCYGSYVNYLPNKMMPVAISSPVSLKNIFVGSIGSQWVGDMSVNAVGSELASLCSSGKRCDSSIVKKIGEYRDAFDTNIVHQCYIAADGEFKNVESRQTFVSAFSTYATARNQGFWWEEYGWTVNSFTTLRSESGWMNTFIFCADGSGDVHAIGSVVLAKLRGSASNDGITSLHAELNAIIHQQGLQLINHASFATLTNDLKMDRPLHLMQNNFVGGHGCQWIDTYVPINTEAESWDVSKFVPQACNIGTGCDRYQANYLMSYAKGGNNVVVACYAAIDGSAASQVEYDNLQASLKEYNIQEGEGYWFGGNSYDGQVDGYYMNSFWSIRTPSTKGKGWLNVFTWCSASGNNDGFGGSVLSALRSHNNNFEEVKSVVPTLANQFGIKLNFDKSCYTESTANILRKPLAKILPSAFVGAHGCQSIKNIVPSGNGASIISSTFWESCGINACSNPLKVTKFGSFDADNKVHDCYVAYDGDYGTSLTTAIAGDALQRFMTDAGKGFWKSADDTNHFINSFLAVRNGGKGNEWVNGYAFCSTGGDPFAYARQVLATLREQEKDWQTVYAQLPEMASSYGVNLFAFGQCTIADLPAPIAP